MLDDLGERHRQGLGWMAVGAVGTVEHRSIKETIASRNHELSCLNWHLPLSFLTWSIVIKKGVKMFSTIAAAAVLPLCAIAGVAGTRQGANQITVNFDKKYQTIDGFGFSEAFQRANNIVNRMSRNHAGPW